MLKFMLFLTLLNKSIISPYKGIDAIYTYQSNNEEKKITFEFNCDYSSLYEVYVTIDLYDEKGTLLKKYNNSLLVTGSMKKSANIEYDNEKNFYALISIKCDDDYIVKDAKLNFYIQDNCYLNINNRSCNRYYKSEFKNGISKDYDIDFLIHKNIFNKYLISNVLNVNNITFHSNYDFRESTSQLIIKDKINEYDFYYDDGYRFLLSIERNNNHSFKLIDNLYIDLLDFKLSEEYFESSINSKNIYFPFYLNDVEYDCAIFIQSFIDIRIDFTVSTSGLLFGECNNSKYCLVRTNYD